MTVSRNISLGSNREALAGDLGQWRQKMGYCSIFAAVPAIFLASAPHHVMAVDLVEPATDTGISRPRVIALTGRNESYSKLDFLRRHNNYLLPHQKRNNSRLAFRGGDDCPGLPIPAGTYPASAPFLDVGDTTGANNTVGLLDGGSNCFYCYSYDVGGPDTLYTFSLSAQGTSPEIRVTSDSATYQPLVYILLGCPASTTVPVGQLVPFNGFPLNVPLYLFVDSEAGSGAYTLKIQDVTVAPAPVAAAEPNPRIDFDGDNKADISVFRPSESTWYLRRSTTGFAAVQFGVATDRLVPADFDGDGKTDIAVYRDGLWLWLNSANGVFRQAGWGGPGDTPQPGDYTGDGLAELAVYRAGTWFTYDIVRGLSTSAQFGLGTDRPVAADYDGDGRTDYAVYRDGIWYLSRSTRGFVAAQFGIASDRPVPSDYDGDGTTDLAVFRDGVWYLQRTTLGFSAFQFGVSGDIPVPDDYDGNGTSDAAVYRNGVWYLNQSAGGFSAVPFGLASDKPVPGAFFP